MEQLTIFDYDQLDQEMAQEMRHLAVKVKSRNAAIAQNIWENGHDLYFAQQELAKHRYGCFIDWAQIETGLSKRMVYHFINVYTNFNCENFTQLKIAPSALYLLSAPSTPIAAREQAIALAESGASITHKLAESLVKKVKAADELRDGQRAERISITPQPENWQADVSATRATAALKTFFRYPGGKSKIAGALVKEIASLAVDGGEYREPFVGGGGVFLPVLSSGTFSRYWINDLDFGVYCVWLAVKQFSNELITKVLTFTPSVEAFYTYKEILSGTCNHYHPAEVALMKVAIHQMSYSGLGTRAGGPIGGVGQKSQYDVGCRWNGESIAEQIANINRAMQGPEIVITNLDYRALMAAGKAVMYLDPPYYEQGNSLYQVRFSAQDHQDLASQLKAAAFPWILSYDKCNDVRNLYDWASVRETEEIHYSITLKSGNAGKQSRFASEYVIAGGGY